MGLKYRDWTIVDWWKFVFHESMFQCQSSTTLKVWHQKGSFAPTRPTVKHTTKVMAVDYIRKIVEGSMNTKQYIQGLESRLLVQHREWYNNENFTFMQDGAPCHTPRTSMEYLHSKSIDVLDWPGNSPDCNPVETLWAIAKRRLHSLTITTKSQLISAIIQAWSRAGFFLPNRLRVILTFLPQQAILINQYAIMS